MYQGREFRRSVAAATTALKIAETAYGPNHPKLPTNSTTWPNCTKGKGISTRRCHCSNKRSRLSKKYLALDHPAFALGLHNVAMLYQRQGNYAQALPLYERALKIWETALGPDHLTVATALNNLAWLLDWMGDDAQAESLSHRAAHHLPGASGTGGCGPIGATATADGRQSAIEFAVLSFRRSPGQRAGRKSLCRSIGL